MPVGEDLRASRERAGLSIRGLAERAGIAASTVWRIETGRLDPTTTMLARLRAATGELRGTDQVTREEAVSLALGRLAASELLRDPDRLLRRARRRIAAMRRRPELTRRGRQVLTEWDRLLEGPLEDVVVALIDPSPRGYELRAMTPFTGMIDDETRLFSIGWSSGTFSACSTHSTMSDLNSRIRSSPRDR